MNMATEMVEYECIPAGTQSKVKDSTMYSLPGVERVPVVDVKPHQRISTSKLSALKILTTVVPILLLISLGGVHFWYTYELSSSVREVRRLLEETNALIVTGQVSSTEATATELSNVLKGEETASRQQSLNGKLQSLVDMSDDFVMRMSSLNDTVNENAALQMAALDAVKEETLKHLQVLDSKIDRSLAQTNVSLQKVNTISDMFDKNAAVQMAFLMSESEALISELRNTSRTEELKQQMANLSQPVDTLWAAGDEIASNTEVLKERSHVVNQKLDTVIATSAVNTDLLSNISRQLLNNYAEQVVTENLRKMSRQFNNTLRDLTDRSDHQLSRIEATFERSGELAMNMGMLSDQLNDVRQYTLNVVAARLENSTKTLEQIDDHLGNITTLIISTSEQYIDRGDCRDALFGSGVYRIQWPRWTIQETPVFCDMTTAGGGWTVVLRRRDGSVNFDRDWNSYKTGFGDILGEFWAGNEFLHQMTSTTGKTYKLRFDMTNYDNEHRYAEYDNFRVGAGSDLYRLRIGSYSGTAGDSLTYNNNMAFSTPERDNNGSSTNCAQDNSAGWWFKSCHYTLPTGPYGVSTGHAVGLIWYHWLGWGETLKEIQMAIRAV